MLTVCTWCVRNCIDVNAHVYTHVQGDGLLVDAKGALFSTVEMSTGLCLIERLVDCSASLLTCTMIEVITKAVS